ncbi:MAG: hypothetical protein A3K19_25100 [Lentisphaerae bacterium RIFOXYB12_FULL_65_16]|nr:MAG: hypothetical protein A3K18_00805 [Lentisphaerae bacterium RIFOXYA12_64_32]OGV91023.1 MAG: hypothetical protein A3K19_25100 [Lentisphaerae bacterium RIFOXYB12_FULL_65_16]
MAADGRSFFTVWYGVCPGWCDEGYWTDPRWLHATLRYSTMAIPVSVARLRQFERPLLDYPLVTPRVNILESNASFLNGYPTHTLRAKAFMFSRYLEKNGWDYGVLWERLILNGKQSLDGSDVILLPNATSMPTEMQVRLRDWVQAGGTLIAVGAAGVYDPWGKPDGTLLKAAFGEGSWKYDARVWVPEKDPTESKVGAYPPRGTVYRASLGKGTVALFSQVYNEAEPEEQILGYVAGGAKQRAFYGVGAKFALTLREDKVGNRWFLTALNADAFDAATDEIRFHGPQVAVLDLELPGIAIPTRREGDESVFRLQLAPGEGVVLELAAAPR